MTKSVKAAIDKILELRTEFSDDDLFEAISVLSKSQNSTNFQRKQNLESENEDSEQKPKTPRKEPKLSKVVADLKEKNPDKYEILSRFDRAFRQGEILKSLDIIRITGASIDKSFDPGKSRKGAISKFMKLIALLPTEEARKQIDRILDSERNTYDSSEDYSRLAAFIISGRQE